MSLQLCCLCNNLGLLGSIHTSPIDHFSCSASHPIDTGPCYSSILPFYANKVSEVGIYQIIPHSSILNLLAYLPTPFHQTIHQHKFLSLPYIKRISHGLMSPPLLTPLLSIHQARFFKHAHLEPLARMKRLTSRSRISSSS